MLDEIGHFALVLALCIAVVQAVLPLYGAAKGDSPWWRWPDRKTDAAFEIPAVDL